VRRYFYVHPSVYQYSGTTKNFARRACAPTRYVHLSSTTYMVPERLEAPYVPSNRTSSLNRERYAMAVRGDGQNFPLRESYPQWYPPHCSPPPRWSPTGYVGGVRGDRQVLPSPGGSGGVGMYDRNKTCRPSKKLLRGRAAYWKALHGSP
jgi:hypothetical protein